MAGDLESGLSVGYRARGPSRAAEPVLEVERLGFDTVLIAEGHRETLMAQ
jgi:alkanesulfonate monooxygenase SsuD/methylene tetrahydromethanopterin reductase-like flavin-dependent oxidoreductase (luciferase family)